MRCYNFPVKRLLQTLTALAAFSLLVPIAASAYSWPIRPFYKQHAIRGYFNDPRLTGPEKEKGFHFGVDISAPDGTSVYAIEAGRARVHGMTVSIAPRRRGGNLLSYWHILPQVKTRQRVRKHQLIGYVAPGAEHVHLAEYKAGTYINPLRLGALAPYIDDTIPQIPKLTFYAFELPAPAGQLSGVVDITADIHDLLPLPLPPSEWQQAWLSPTLVRWRIVQGQVTLRPWETAVDFRRYVFPLSLFDFVYGPGTFQNKENRAGRYEYYLAHQFDTRGLPNGAYVLQVDALDAQENLGQASFPFTVVN
jgi:murein DD-endopeptidase MepM/ murein hydrolase activator NlpD